MGHFQEFLVTTSMALAPVWITVARKRAWARTRWLRDRYHQATVRMGGWIRRVLKLFALFARLHEAVKVFSIFLIMLHVTLAPGFGLFIQSTFSRSYWGTIWWWRNLLCHYWILIELFANRVVHVLFEKTSFGCRKAWIINDHFDQCLREGVWSWPMFETLD